MDIVKRMLLEARYIISLEKSISDLVPIMKIDEKVIYNDRLKGFDLELYNRVISVLGKKC